MFDVGRCYVWLGGRQSLPGGLPKAWETALLSCNVQLPSGAEAASSDFTASCSPGKPEQDSANGVPAAQWGACVEHER